MEQKENNLGYISLYEATKFCEHSQKYLNLRVRQGKLKAIKMGRNWVIRKEWLVDYLKRAEKYKNHLNGKKPTGLAEKITKSDFRFQPSSVLLILAIFLLAASFIFSNKKTVDNFKSFTGYVSEKTGEITEASSWLVAMTDYEYFNYTKEILKNYSLWFSEQTKEAVIHLSQAPASISSFLPDTINNISKKIGESLNYLADAFVKIPLIIAQPFQKKPSQPAVVQSTDQQVEQLESQIAELKQQGIQTKEITKEVSQVTEIQPIKEITKETVFSRIDDQSLKTINASIAYLETEVAKRLYAPGGVISQPIYITQPVSSPKIYQENGDIVLQTAGSGSVILSAATGMQISGSQVVIDSTDRTNPLVYIADKARIDGDTEILGNLSVGGFKLPTGASINYVLTSDESGNGTWAPPQIDTDWLISGDIMYATDTISYLGIGTNTPSANFTLMQRNNGDTMILSIRKTDTAPSGDFIKYQSASGVDLFRVDNSGNAYQGGIISSGSVTITSSSTPQLRVQLDSSNEITFTTNSAGTTTIAINGASPSLNFIPQSNNVNTFSFRNASDNSILSIDTLNGRVGIGTSSPAAYLHLIGGSTSTASLVMNPGSILTVPYSGAIENDGTYAYYTNSSLSRIILNTSSVSKEPTGFPNRTDTSFSFDNTLDPNPTFTITGTNFNVYYHGEKWTKSTASVDITDTEGIWFFYYNSAGTLTASQTVWDMETTVSIAYIYWDATNNQAIALGDERHGLTMDWATHKYLHVTVGTRYGSGLTLTGTITGNGDNDPDAEVSIADGIIYDEDLLHTITDGSPQDISPIAKAPVFYRSGSAVNNWRKDASTNFPVKQGTLRIAYNLNTAGTWTTPDATQGDWVAMWIFGTNDVNNPVIAILGQRLDTTLTNAMNNNTYESMSFGNLPFQEMKVLYRLIFQTSTVYANTPHARLRDIQDYRSISNLPAGTYVATDHGALTGLSDDDHPQYALLAGRTSGQSLIGGADANGTLTIQGNAAATGNTLTNQNLIFKVGDSGSTTAMTILNNGYVGIGTTTPSEMLSIQGTSTAAIFGIWASSSAPVLYVNSAGNVGIGTTTPRYKLDVYGSIHASGSIYASSTIIGDGGRATVYMTSPYCGSLASFAATCITVICAAGKGATNYYSCNGDCLNPYPSVCNNTFKGYVH